MAKGGLERLRRIVRTVFFMVAMVASLLVSSLAVLVAVGDVLVPCVLISSFTCVRCYGFKEHLRRYAFKSSLTDIPLVSVVRSVIIICMLLYFLRLFCLFDICMICEGIMIFIFEGVMIFIFCPMVFYFLFFQKTVFSELQLVFSCYESR